MTLPACFLGPLVQNIFFLPFTQRLCLSLILSCVSSIQQKNGSCFQIHYVHLCLFIEKLRAPVLRDINEQCLLIPVTLVVTLVVYEHHFFWFCWYEIIFSIYGDGKFSWAYQCGIRGLLESEVHLYRSFWLLESPLRSWV